MMPYKLESKRVAESVAKTKVSDPWFSWGGFWGALIFLVIYITACGRLERW